MLMFTAPFEQANEELLCAYTSVFKNVELWAHNI